VRLKSLFCVVATLASGALIPSQAQETMRLVNAPALSPDGKQVVFGWNGDIWLAPTTGGSAVALTNHPAKDDQPSISPDGQTLAFVSDREGSPQIFLKPMAGGPARQVTFHTSGYQLLGWSADGKKLLAQVVRDHDWTRSPERLVLVDPNTRKKDELLFDAAGKNGSLSPDGNQVLFVREGTQWWRKGYHGSQAWQLWSYDRAKDTFTRLLQNPPLAKGPAVRHAGQRGSMAPLWKPDGKGFYYIGGQSGSFNLWEHDLATGNGRQLTQFTDDSVVQPSLSADGSTLVFRHLFDLYVLRPASGKPAEKINIVTSADRAREKLERRTLTTASSAAFTSDGLEMAFIAGGDVWVMDTELKEPKQVTRTPEEERSIVFSPDNSSLYFVSDAGGKTEIIQATRGDAGKYWWQNDRFTLQPITTDGNQKSSLQFSPDGKKLALVLGRGDLAVIDADGKNGRVLSPGYSAPDFDWSPDSKWIAFSRQDSDFNSDIYLLPLDGSRPAFNVSRHPDNEGEPAWSPDGKILAFTGRRTGDEVDIHYLYLNRDDDEQGSRERTLEKALEKMKSRRSTGGARAAGTTGSAGTTKPEGEAGKPAEGGATAAKPATSTVVIDFERMNERLRTIKIADSAESGLFWSPDSKKLSFSATVSGARGTFYVEFPDSLTPKSLNSGTGSNPRWLKNNSVVWLASGVPASFTPSVGGAAPPSPAASVLSRMGRTGPTPATATTAPATGEASGTQYRFSALQEVDLPAKHAAVFDLCWRTMRDNWYDERLNNRDWNKVKDKYLPMAFTAPDLETLATTVNLMLGELNGSHLAFTANGGTAPARRGAPAAPATGETPTGKWSLTTLHPGLLFDEKFPGPGWKIRSVVTDSPAAHKKHALKPGEIVLSVNGKAVSPGIDPAELLTVAPNTDLALTIRDAQGKERQVTVRPIPYSQARSLLYPMWIAANRAKVDQLSGGTLGYLHIQAMDQASFEKFEEALYDAGAGKQGLIIDVRENGGGSTADLLLTALTQPEHAVTIPRGGTTPGYPHDRKIFATWNKPIVVLCNQNSFSNAEIFSHAIKTLKRGKVVGVPTAGGVISTGGTTIMDVGFLRLPFRGWYLTTNGEDLELNGAEPDVVIWPEPQDAARGVDRQLEKGVEMLKQDVSAYQNRIMPAPRKASQR
jgi:tricorn protease